MKHFIIAANLGYDISIPQLKECYSTSSTKAKHPSCAHEEFFRCASQPSSAQAPGSRALVDESPSGDKEPVFAFEVKLKKIELLLGEATQVKGVISTLSTQDELPLPLLLLLEP
eukprot:scaffold5762_cov94-Skeletonema_marinoi.AAC.1